MQRIAVNLNGMFHGSFPDAEIFKGAQNEPSQHFPLVSVAHKYALVELIVFDDVHVTRTV